MSKSSKSKILGPTRMTTIADDQRRIPEEGRRLAVPALIQIEGPEPGFRHKLAGLSAVYTIGRQEGTDVRIDDQTISRKHARIQVQDGPAGLVARIQDLGSTNGVVVNGEKVNESLLRSGDKVLLGHVLFRFDLLDAKDIEYQERIIERVKSAEIDPLTGLFTRRFLTDEIPPFLDECDRNQIPLCVLMMDLDRFKEVNDRHGHATGDAVLKRAGALVARSTREEDLAIRYGGEELLIVLAGTRIELAARIAERICLSFREEEWASLAQGLAITISIGVAEREPKESFEGLAKRADRALYRAKNEGRDRVVLDTT